MRDYYEIIRKAGVPCSADTLRDKTIKRTKVNISEYLRCKIADWNTLTWRAFSVKTPHDRFNNRHHPFVANRISDEFYQHRVVN
jgi:hypothetical protein